MFQSYALAYLREDPRVKPKIMAQGIALFSQLRQKLPNEKIYSLLSASMRCLTSPSRYPELLTHSDGIICRATALDHIDSWRQNNVITAKVSNIAKSTYMTLAISNEKYQGLEAKSFAQVCTILAEKITRGESPNDSIYEDLVTYTRKLEVTKSQPVFVSNVIRHLQDIPSPPSPISPPAVLKKEEKPRQLEEAPDVTLGPRDAGGAFGSIYYIESSDGQQVAVKKQMISPMIIQEISIMASCDSPNIIKLRSFKFDGKMAYMYMPRGEPLSNYTPYPLSKDLWETVYVQARSLTKLPRKLRRLYGGHILSGLHYLHENGIIHGDVKPTNVVIVDGIAQLIDFGLSVCYTFSKFDNQRKGTDVYSLPYRPPEINFLEATNYSYSADVWAAGVTLLELETGILPTVYGESSLISNEMNVLKTTVDVIGPPFEDKPYELFPFMNQGIGGLGAVEDLDFRSIITSMMEWTPGDRATIPDLIPFFEKSK